MKCLYEMTSLMNPKSHPARGARIEIALRRKYYDFRNVAPREGCAD